MRWLLLLLASVAAQPAMPLLPSGVTMSMVTRIDVEAPGAKVALIQEDDGVEATITNRLSYAPVIKFDHATGTLTVTAVPASSSSMLKPGMFAAFVAVALCAFQSKGKNSPFVLLLLLGLGVANATLIVDDLILRIPGCWHPENNGTSVIFDQQCQNSTMSSFQAPAVPEASVSSGAQWKPVNPAIDSAKHSKSEDFQYEVWRAMYGKVHTNATRDAFYNFTRECQKLNALPDRTWLAACNQFAGMTPEDWKATIISNNGAVLEEFHNSPQGRRLLETAEYSDVEENRRRLLQTTSFSWVGTGKLTPVKDQGQCGSCYAHSTSSQMEAQTAITLGTVPVVLSREQLKSCSAGSPGCNGGYPAYMYTYAKTGLGTEAALPYQPTNTACPNSLPAISYKNTGYVSIANNELAFKAALATAPVAVTVCADTWSNYAGGVFKNCQTGCSVNHAVLLVGYGTDATLGPYWLIQNSWNTWWGEAGFIRLPRTDSGTAGVGMCGLTTYVGYQASGITANGGGSTGTACQGSWSAWSSCTKTCGGGTQTRTWTTTAQPTGNGAACPNPTTQSQSCNTALCSGTGNSTSCLRLTNTVLGSNGDGDYKSVTGWNQNWCGTALLPQYLNKAGTIALFFYATNCYNNVRTAGQWGLGPVAIPRAAYQWGGPQAIVNGVIPAPNAASWTIQFSAGTCV